MDRAGRPRLAALTRSVAIPRMRERVFLLDLIPGLQLLRGCKVSSGFFGLACDFELNRTLGLLQHHDSSGGDRGPMRNVANAQL